MRSQQKQVGIFFTAFSRYSLGINCEDAFHTLAAAMRERASAANMNSDDSDDQQVGVIVSNSTES